MKEYSVRLYLLCRRMSAWALLLVVLLPQVSCRRAAEQARRDIRVEAVERRGLTGVEVAVRVKNDTGRKLLLKAASLEVFYAGDRVLEIDLRKGIEVPRRTTGSFSTLWRMIGSDPLASSVLSKKIAQDDISQIGISFTLQGRSGMIPVKISQEMMPLSEFLNIFEVSLVDVKNYLKE